MLTLKRLREANELRVQVRIELVLSSFALSLSISFAVRVSKNFIILSVSLSNIAFLHRPVYRLAL